MSMNCCSASKFDGERFGGDPMSTDPLSSSSLLLRERLMPTPAVVPCIIRQDFIRIENRFTQSVFLSFVFQG